MNRNAPGNNESNQGDAPIVTNIGPESKLFFKRYNALCKAGIVNPNTHALLLCGNLDNNQSQIEIIKRQTRVPLNVAIAGLVFIREQEKSPVDPLSLPWLN